MATSEQDVNFKPSKLRIIKNLVVISSSFVLLFSGFDGLSSLQSTMNKEDGVGTISQALTYVMFCISSLLIPKYVIQKLGCKFSIIVSQMFYIPWVASNFYPHWIAMIPSSMLTGIAASTLWGAQGTYFNKASVLYCSWIENERKDGARDSLKASKKSNFTLEPLSVQSSLKLTEPSISKLNGDSQLACDSAKPDGAKKDSSYVYYENCDSNGVGDVNPVVEIPLTERTSDEPSVETVLSNRHSKKDNGEVLQNFADHEAINARFFGCHSLAYKTAEIWSNLLSYYVLKAGSNAVMRDISSCSCGAYFCNAESECLTENIGGISEERRYLLSGVCVALSSMAIILLLLCLDPIEGKREPVTFSLNILMATLNQCKKKEQLFLIPITVLLGLAQGFYTADVTKAYIGCAWGTYHVGLVTVAYGVSCAMSSSISGWLVRHIGRIPIISLGIAVTIGTNILLLTWTPNVSQSYVFYIIASLWGVIIGTIWSQIPAFYGVLFKEDEEAAFASFYAWESLGWTFALVYSNYLCTYIKIYILIFVACSGLIGYLITERRFTSRKNEISQQTS